MNRVRLVDENATPEIAALTARIRGARGGAVHAFYRMLMHSPALAAAWFEFNNAVRFQSTLDERTSELVIMRVAIITGVDYVVKVHREKYADAAGLARETVDALTDWRRSRRFSQRDRAALAYADAMTRDVAVPDGVFRRLRAQLSEREIVELTALVAAYNMHVRMIMAFAIEPAKSER